jgi:hypothetical protein
MTKGHVAAPYGSGVSSPAGVGLEHVQTDKMAESNLPIAR